VISKDLSDKERDRNVIEGYYQSDSKDYSSLDKNNITYQPKVKIKISFSKFNLCIKLLSKHQQIEKG
jgi:cell division FtsZ-interacting protein ZapD